MSRVRLLPPIALTLAVLVALGGCGSSDEQTTSPAQPSATGPTDRSADPSADSSTAPTSPATPASASTPVPSGRKTGLLGPRVRTQVSEDHLLAAERMPMLAGGRTWTVRSTAPEDPADAPAVGACQKSALGAIGAMSSVRRTFHASGGIAATQVVARFPDSRSAWRAHEVLAAWRADCEERLALPHATVGPLESVEVHAGTADSYRAAYGRKAAARSAGFGILRTGAYLTVVEITAASSDYPDGWDPTRVAVRRISRTF